jgi:hypothetical protein
VANLGTYIDGAYAGTYNSVAIGPTENGWRLRKTMSGQAIDESDQYGNTLIDFFYRGGSCRLSCDAQEYKAGTIAPFWPWGSMGQVITTANPIGIRASDVAKAVVLTSTANTPAAAAPASLTATYAVMAPGQDVNLDFHSKLRTVPIILQLLPYASSSNTVWFILT